MFNQDKKTVAKRVEPLASMEQLDVTAANDTSDAIKMWQALSDTFAALSPSQLLKVPSNFAVLLLLSDNIAGVFAHAKNVTVPLNTLIATINGTEVLAQIGGAVLTGDYSRCGNSTLSYYNDTVGSNATVAFAFHYRTFGTFSNAAHHRTVVSNIDLKSAIANVTKAFLECIADVFANKQKDISAKGAGYGLTGYYLLLGCAVCCVMGCVFGIRQGLKKNSAPKDQYVPVP